MFDLFVSICAATTVVYITALGYGVGKLKGRNDTIKAAAAVVAAEREAAYLHGYEESESLTADRLADEYQEGYELGVSDGQEAERVARKFKKELKHKKPNRNPDYSATLAPRPTS